MAGYAPTNKDELEKYANDKRKAARTLKAQWELDFKECYFFAAPHRQRSMNALGETTQTRVDDAPELNTDQAFLLCQDFVTEIVNTFMPEAQPWCERGPGMDLPAEAWDQVKDDVRTDDQKIFSAMKASNLYPEVTKAFYPDLAIGTVAMWIERPHPSRPIVVSAIPLRELECNLGPYGDIDDRFAVRDTRNCHVRELVSEEVWDKMDAALRETINTKPTQRTKVIWGFWRKWEQKTDEVWQHVLMVGDKLVHDGELKGEGCCPLLVARFNPSADWPWGLGPLIMALPTLRQIDELESMRIENAELNLVPPITYPSDSFANIEHGLEPRMAYPVQVGHQDAVKKIYDAPEPNVANYQYEEKIHTLRKLFFVDYPEQTGDTPPTLGQWLDEMARAQRRVGTPGLPFWREGPAQIFLRFKYLLEAAGAIAPIKVDGATVALLPYNPAQAAAEQQEVGMAVKAIQIAGQAWPEEFKIQIDGKKSMEAIFNKMRVTLLKFRPQEQVEAAVAQISQLAGARQAPEGAEVTPGPAAVGPGAAPMRAVR